MFVLRGQATGAEDSNASRISSGHANWIEGRLADSVGWLIGRISGRAPPRTSPRTPPETPPPGHPQETGVWRTAAGLHGRATGGGGHGVAAPPRSSHGRTCPTLGFSGPPVLPTYLVHPCPPFTHVPRPPAPPFYPRTPTTLVFRCDCTLQFPTPAGGSRSGGLGAYVRGAFPQVVSTSGDGGPRPPREPPRSSPRSPAKALGSNLGAPRWPPGRLGPPPLGGHGWPEFPRMPSGALQGAPQEPPGRRDPTIFGAHMGA